MFRLGVVDHVRLNLEHASQNYTVHAKAADRLAGRTSFVRISVLVLLGAATAAAMVNLVEPGRPAQIFAAVTVLIAFAAHAAYLAIDFEGRVDAHRSCAHRLWLVCDKYRSLLAEIEDGLLDRTTILQRRDELSAQVQSAYEQAFALDQRAYESLRQPPDDESRGPESGEERDAMPPPPVATPESRPHA
jgi:ABC-type transport system involved in cytochrome bd biosynthesis fused ATPase/permease subunit